MKRKLPKPIAIAVTALLIFSIIVIVDTLSLVTANLRLGLGPFSGGDMMFTFLCRFAWLYPWTFFIATHIYGVIVVFSDRFYKSKKTKDIAIAFALGAFLQWISWWGVVTAILTFVAFWFAGNSLKDRLSASEED